MLAPQTNPASPAVLCVEYNKLFIYYHTLDFNPIELWRSQLKSFLRRFAFTAPEMIDRIIAVALYLINPVHLKNWFANCCQSTS
jgi:hypothetical protein